MAEWYEALSAVERVLFLTGIFATVIFVIQFVLTFVGLGDEGDFDSDEASFTIADVFTLRNGIAFLMGFSWGGLMAFSWGISAPALIAIIGVVIGSLLVGVNMLLFIGMAQLRHDGSIRMENAIGANATVTLAIPAQRSGVGKVRLSIQGRLREYHAVTEGAALPRNAAVIVGAIEGSQLVVDTH